MLEVPEKSLIKVSYISMKSFEFRVSNKTFYEIKLEDESIALDEVVAIGYGTQSKATVTAGIESVKAKELSAAVSASPLNNLQGKVAGLDIRQTTGQPGAQPVVHGIPDNSLNSDGALCVCKICKAYQCE